MKNMIVELQKGKNKGTLAEVLSETTNKKGLPVYKVVRLDNQRKGTWQVAKCALNEAESIQAIAKSIITPDIARIFQAGIEMYLNSNDGSVEERAIYKMDFKDMEATPTVRVISIENGIVSFTKIGGVFPLCTMKVSEFRQAIVEKIEFGTELEIPSEIIQTVESEPIQLEIEVEKPVCGECGEPMDSEILHDKFDGFVCQSCADDADKAADELADEHIEDIIAKTAENAICSDFKVLDTAVSPDELLENQAVIATNNQMTPEDIEKVKISFAKCGYKTIGIEYEDGVRFGFILPGSKLKREPKQSLSDAITQFVDFDVIDCVTSKMFEDVDEAKFDIFKNISYYEDGDTEYNGNYVVIFDDIQWIEETEAETTEATEEVA